MSTENCYGTILAIDDDERLHERAAEFLRANGFRYHKLVDGREAVQAIAALEPDIVLLDVQMPGEDGFSVLAKIRARSRVPVIMLTAQGQETDRIVGLELGADDYLPKPFNPRELVARIKAVLRRTSDKGDAAEAETAPAGEPSVLAAIGAGEMRLGEYVLNTKRQTLSLGKNTASLSTAELSLLHAFFTHSGVVLGREQLMQLAFGSDAHSTSRSIDVHVSRLRSLLKELGEEAVRIRTVWGSGYCWIED